MCRSKVQLALFLLLSCRKWPDPVGTRRNRGFAKMNMKRLSGYCIFELMFIIIHCWWGAPDQWLHRCYLLTYLPTYLGTYLETAPHLPNASESFEVFLRLLPTYSNTRTCPHSLIISSFVTAWLGFKEYSQDVVVVLQTSQLCPRNRAHG